MSDTERVRLVLVTGLHRTATEEVGDRLLRADPGVVVVHHDLRSLRDGIVRRRVRAAAGESVRLLELAHGCVSCTLREDVLPLLLRLARQPGTRRIVLHLDPAMEPEPVCQALATPSTDGAVVTDVVDIEAVVAVVDEGSWLADATGAKLLAEPGRDLDLVPDDDRTLAQIAIDQVAFADAVVVTGQTDNGWDAARLAAVFDRLVPDAPRAPLGNGRDLLDLLAGLPASARRGEVWDAHAPLLRGTPPLEPDCGVVLTLFSERRPFHPARLCEAIDVLLEGVVRTWGRVWVASQPDTVLWLESAGGELRVSTAGDWLAPADDGVWERTGAQRRAKAALDWHPRFGDRVQELAILCHDSPASDITATLHAALLTDEELAAGEAAWRDYPDPFGDGEAATEAPPVVLDRPDPITDNRKDSA